MSKKVFVFLLVLLFGAGFFCVQKSCWAADHLVINEVYYDPTENNDTGKEWIELYNGTANPIELTGYDLNAVSGDYYTFPNFTLGSGNFVVVHWRADGVNTAADLYTGIFGFGGNMGNTNGWVALFNSTVHSSNTIIDYVKYGAGGKTWESAAVAAGIWTAGDYIINVDEGHSFARKPAGFDTNQSSDFEDLSSPNPQSSTEPMPESPVASSTPTSPTATSSPVVSLRYNLGDVVINEFVADPTDNEVEWIEIYNTIGQEIDLSGWTIEDGSKTKTNLTGQLGIEGSSRFKIIAKPAGILNNSGDIIILRDGLGNLIDQVAYGNWDDGNIGNNAPKANDPNSVARKSDGYNSFNNLNDFVITTTPTKGKSNIITSLNKEEEISAEQRALYDYSSDIFVSEILPNPIGDDSQGEFIELFNNGTREVNLFGWSLSDSGGLKHKISTTSSALIIKAGEYLAIYRSQTKIVLNNNGDSVYLFQPFAEKPCQTIKYERAAEGNSYNYNAKENICETTKMQNDNNCWIWSETITPNKANIFIAINHPPKVDFNFSDKTIVGQPVAFDSSDTFDQDGDELKFNWDFGDGVKLNLPSPEHTFTKAGSYVVVLSVSDGQNEIKKEKIIKVPGDNNDVISASTTDKKSAAPVIINELLPSPIGNDAIAEWIELYNPANSAVNLLNWQLDDKEGGSAPYKFLQDLWLAGNDYLVVKRLDSGLALNNTGDAVRLFSDLDELIDQVEYEAAVEGEAYARGANGKWFWTNVLTPGEKNIISVADSQSNNFVLASNQSKEQAGETVETTLEKIAEYEVGALLKVKGVVAVLPGVLGAQFFYIVGSPGLQIYNYKKEFPKLKVGDYIEVSGELVQIKGEKRLKTKDMADIKILEHRDVPAAEQLSCDKISEDYIGQLVAVSGEVTDRKGSTVYLDDGNDEVIVYLKQATNIKPSNLAEGKSYRITGILGKTNSGLKIMPRSIKDIVLINQPIAVGSVLGEVAASNEWAVAERNKKLELFKYLLVIAVGVIIVLGGLLIKAIRK